MRNAPLLSTLLLLALLVPAPAAAAEGPAVKVLNDAIGTTRDLDQNSAAQAEAAYAQAQQSMSQAVEMEMQALQGMMGQETKEDVMSAAINLNPGAHHSFSGQPGQYISVTNPSEIKGSFSSTVSSEVDSYSIGAYATRTIVPPGWPTKITNTGKVELIVSLD